MIGLDTSIVLRLLLGEPAPQAAVARRRIEEAKTAEEPVVVTDLVLSEAYYALAHHYAVPKAKARSLLAAMAASGAVEIDPAEAVSALTASGGAGFVDRLIHVRHQKAGATTLTFERRFGRLSGAVRLTAK